MTSQPTHEQRTLPDPDGWVLYVSRDEPRRLVVFVHGFNGKPVNTWQSFPEGARTSAWWRESDLLFVRYRTSEGILAVAAGLIEHVPRFFPTLPDELLEIRGVRVRALPSSRYRQLILVGHSLGGLVIRRALSDAADEWVGKGNPEPRPGLLEAEVRLFSPASAGFRPAGVLGLVRATRMWGPVELWLRSRSAYTDLQAGSPTLVDTRARTQRLAAGSDPAFDALRARILWANPENVVVTERYDTDHPLPLFAESGKGHMKVCKPGEDYLDPWYFVEHGRRRP